MNEFNVLLAAATNGTPSGSLFDALFARYIAPQESWRELESPLPITILAAGEDLIDYRIYGNTVGGEFVGERTENLFDKNSEDNLRNHSIRTSTGEIVESNFFTATHKINVTGGQSYVVEIFDSGTTAYIYTVEYDEDDQFVKATNLLVTGGTAYKVITIDAATTYVRMSLLTSLLGKNIFVPGSTAPTSYIPFGYKLPIKITAGGTTTDYPVYIGGSQLMAEEYVDYEEQKVYKRTENLFDASMTFEDGYISAPNGTIVIANEMVHTRDYIPIKNNSQYVLTGKLVPIMLIPSVAMYDAQKNYISRITGSTGANKIVFTTHADCSYVRLSVNDGYNGFHYDPNTIMLTEGSTAPESYIPYIQPTDPPVPFPALPTIRGETIIDYNPSETPAVEPEKMYVKFKP